MMTKNKVIVIGGGPAGLMAAGKAAESGNAVILFEKNQKVGRKLMITGKGRCNVTNNCDVRTCIEAVPRNGRFLYSAFNNFSPEDTMRFFESRGVRLKTERGNRVFPESDKSLDIVDCLFNFVRKNKVRIIWKTVKDILVEDGTVRGVVSEDEKSYYCDKLIIACGGKSYPQTGSTGDGYIFAEKAGHTIIPPEPSLVPLISESRYCKELQGLALKNVKIKIINKDNKKIIYEDFGEMLFTHFGVSGPVILSGSAHLKNPQSGCYRLLIDLKPALNDEKLDARIQRDLKKNLNRAVGNSLFELLPKSIVPVVLKLSDVSDEIQCNGITREQRRRILETIKNFPVDINGFRPITEAIITRGGVNVKEINPKTMESKLVKGLFFAGEVIDADAYTGGFNLQIAFSTGFLAGSTEL